MKIQVKDKGSKKWLDPEILLIVLPILGLLIVLIIALNYEVLAEKKHTVRNAQMERKIFSLKSSGESSGRFYLGYGSFEKTDYYVYLQKDEKFNGFTKEKVPVSKTLIVEKDIEPNIVMNYQIIENIEKRPWFRKEYKSIDSVEYDIFTKIPGNVGYKYIITVPPGTVTEKLTFDPL